MALTNSLCLDVIHRNEFVEGCIRDELLRKILAPNTALLGGGGGGGEQQITTTTTSSIPIDTATINETGAAV